MSDGLRVLEVIVALLNSRKAQVAFATIVAAVLAVFGFKDFPPDVIMVIVAAIATIGGVLINAIKAEDVAKHTAAGMVAAANVTATQPTPPAVGIDANTVSVTTTDGPQPPASPTLGNMGG